MFWTYRVKDPTSWASTLKVLNTEDAGARERRQKYGMVRRWVYRSVDDPSEVMLVAQFRSREGAEGLLRDPEGIRAWQERTGMDLFPPVLITEEMEELHWNT
jgi:hypothetical protein